MDIKYLKEHDLVGLLDENVQEAVIQSLMDGRAYKTAEAYIIYRQKRTEIRESMVDAVEVIEGYVGGSNWRIKENANVGYSIGGLILRTSERVTAEYWLNLYPRAVAEAHKSAAIHVHGDNRRGQLDVLVIDLTIAKQVNESTLCKHD